MKRANKTKVKARKHDKMLGGFVNRQLSAAVDVWVNAEPERDRSKFLRIATREKLQRDGIHFDERVPAETT